MQLDARYCMSDAEIAGKPLTPGTRIALLIGGANRDPEAFDDPDRLDVTRDAASNISFGRGIHHCLGAPLARLEGRIAFEVLLERFDEIRFCSQEPVQKPNIVLRGMQEFPVRVSRSQGRHFTGAAPAEAAAKA